MKKIIALILPLFIITGCSAPMDSNNEVEAPVNAVYVKSIWITYYELHNLIKDNEKDFETTIKDVFKKLMNMGFNTVTVQVRPCADALYKSKYYVSSQYAFGQQGSEMPYDPLSVMCKVCDELNLRLEAWINPYRVSQDKDINKLCDDNIAKKWYNDDKKKSNVYIADNGIYFNPASNDVTDLIVNGVKEIVENYNITSIHFDDYFYPTTAEDIDKNEYDNYKKNDGKLSLDNYRRDVINNMVSSVYKAIKSINQNVLFGISPASNISNDYSKLYADVAKWSSEEGYVDYICPQIYFGFRNVYQPFMFTTKKWISTAKCDLYIGLPLYKVNTIDNYAAEHDDSIKNEFVDNSNIIARQITYLSKLDEIKGFYVFSYSYLFDENAKTEVENMLKVMQNSSPN